jgi:hypothetical protein
MNNNTTMMSKINAKTRAARGHMPVWYYYADPVTITGENWWNFQYTTSLAGYAMDDWTRRYSSKPEVDQRLSYAAKLANIGAINSGQISSDPANIGAVSWTYQAGKGNYGALGLDGGPLFNGWRGMSGEADLGLFGAIKTLSSDVAVDPIFGLYGYGCDVTESGNSYTITPKDGVFQRLHLISQKLSLELNRDQYTSAIVAKSKNNVRLTLKNTTTGTAHTTVLILTGLAAGTYDVLVDGTKTGSVTAVNGSSATVRLNIGTAASYDIRIQTGTGNPTPAGDVVAHYDFNETSGSIAADLSGNGQQANVNGGSWGTGRNGNALLFNGTAAYASLPGGLVSSVNDFTIAAWVRVNTHNGWARLFDFGAGTDRYMFLTPKAEGTGMRFAITVSGNGQEQQLNAPELATGVWKHVAVTLSGNTGVIYVDGVEATRNSNMTLKPSSLGLTDQNYIGKSQFDDPYLNGAIDELIIYNRALTVQEIRSLSSVGSAVADLKKVASSYAEGAD